MLPGLELVSEALMGQVTIRARRRLRPHNQYFETNALATFHFRDLSLAEKGQAALRRPMTAYLDMTLNSPRMIMTMIIPAPFSTAIEHSRTSLASNKIVKKNYICTSTADIRQMFIQLPSLGAASTNHTHPYLLAPISPMTHVHINNSPPQKSN